MVFFFFSGNTLKLLLIFPRGPSEDSQVARDATLFEAILK